MKGLVFEDLPIAEVKPDIITNKEFVPHFLTGEISVSL